KNCKPEIKDFLSDLDKLLFSSLNFFSKEDLLSIYAYVLALVPSQKENLACRQVRCKIACIIYSQLLKVFGDPVEIHFAPFYSQIDPFDKEKIPSLGTPDEVEKFITDLKNLLGNSIEGQG